MRGAKSPRDTKHEMLEDKSALTSMKILFLSLVAMYAFLVSSCAHHIQENRLIGHAFGKIDEHTYTNSLESFYANYGKGRRVFEVDLSVTADGHVVCLHQGREKWYGLEKRISQTTLSEFKKSKILNQYTPMALSDLVDIMEAHPDILIVTDTKRYMDYILKEFIRLADQVDPAISKRIIPQIYNERDYFIVKEISPFREIIYSLYRTRASDRRVIDFISVKDDITALTVSERRFNKDLANKVAALGKSVYVHTINDPRIMKAYLELGAHGFYTDNYFFDEEGDFPPSRPGSWAIHNKLADIYRKNGMPEKAEEHLQKAIYLINR